MTQLLQLHGETTLRCGMASEKVHRSLKKLRPYPCHPWQNPGSILSGFSVEIPSLRGNLSPVPSTLSPQRKNRRQPKGAAARKAFWARPANAELDRSGDWLLKNHSTTRAMAASRAGPA